MPFPFVAVTLPPETPPAYVAALLEACTQAYGEGDCRSASATGRVSGALAPAPDVGIVGTGAAAEKPDTSTSPSAPPLTTNASAPRVEARILATIGWHDALRADIFLGLPYWLNSRWIEWHLDFKEQDQLVERHRAVGFALGRLAVTVAEVARREREVQEAKADTNTNTNKQSTEPPAANPPPLQAPPTDTTPPVFLEPLPLPNDDEDEPSNIHAAALLGAEFGTGFRGVRLGGTAGIDLVFSDRFVLGVRGYLTGDSFHATFAGAELRGGVVWEPDPLELQLNLGAGWNYVSASADKTASENVVGGVLGLNLALSRRAISPFLGVGASLLQEGINTNVMDLSAYGPVVPRVQLGIKVRPDLF